MPDLKGFDPSSVVGAVKAAEKEAHAAAERTIAAAATRAVDDVLQATRAMAEMPKTPLDLIASSTCFFVKDVDVQYQDEIRSVDLNMMRSSGSRIIDSHGLRESVVTLPAGRYRAIFALIPLPPEPK